MILRARAVWPVSGPVISDGAVALRGKRIAAVGRWRELAGQSLGPTLDLGEVVLMPGLINAHCHLDYTQMAGQFAPPKVFSDWLKLITETKAGWSLSDYAESWRTGAQMLVRTGTTTVGDIEAVPQLLPSAWRSTPLRVLSFLEVLGITNRRTPAAIVAEALEKGSSLRGQRNRVGLSPHAPYSTVPELLRLSGRAARGRRWPLCIHVAESALEYAMFVHGEGEMYDWLRRSGRDMSDCGNRSPVQHLECCGLLGSNLLAAHVNYLRHGDAAVLARRRVSVVHCPRSYDYFRHEQFPLHSLLRAGVNVCLGTDSLASVVQSRKRPAQLSMFEEMRALVEREPGLSPRQIVRMSTVNGARALGMTGQLGELIPGALADVVALPCAGPRSHIAEAVTQHQGDVSASLIDGRWAIKPE